MTPPASTEPMHCDHECVCAMYDGFKDADEDNFPCPCKPKECKDDTRARGPAPSQPARLACQFDLQAYQNKEILFEDIRACSGETCNYCGRFNKPVAQQAPAISLPKDTTNLECIDEGLKALSDYFNAAIEGGERKAALRRMWDQQMGILAALLKNHRNEPALSGVKNALAEYQAYEKGFSDGKKEHDAALIAQAIAEDRKRPRPPCEECHWQERLEKEKAQAREDVLKEVLESFNSLDSYGEEEGYPLVSLLDVQNRVELIQERSLRPEVGK